MDTLNLILWLFSMISFTTYFTYIWKKYGILKSISDSYYKLNGLKKMWFTLFIWSVAIPFIIIGSTPLMFFAGALLAFVGAAPAFKKEMEGKVHVVGAVGGILLGFISLFMDFQEYWLCGIMGAFTLYASLKKTKNHTWWIETLAFLIISIGLFMKRVLI